jgi:hypothetical protein
MNSAGSHLTGSTNINQSIHNNISKNISQNFNNINDRNQINSFSENTNKPTFYATVR